MELLELDQVSQGDKDASCSDIFSWGGGTWLNLGTITREAEDDKLSRYRLFWTDFFLYLLQLEYPVSWALE